MLAQTTGSFTDAAYVVGVAAATEVVAFALAVAWARAAGKICVVDVVWPMSFVAVAVTTLVAARSAHVGTTTVQLVVLAMVGAWGIRLGLHLFSRQRGAPEDRRYVAIMRQARPGKELSYALVSVFGPQCVLALVVSLPVAAVMVGGRPVGWVAVCGVAVYLVGLGFEAIGDAQLTAFLADPRSEGRTMTTGLWAWTRHPNYFGDAAVWWGIWGVAASTGLAVATVVGPIVMTILLTSVSGRPLLERSLSRRKLGWDDYVRATSSFLPRPPRR